MMTLTREQQRQVRDHLGHGRGDRTVTIHRDGTVTYIGSLDGFDYDQHRVRLLGGDADELLREVRAYRDMCPECGCLLDAVGNCGTAIDVHGTPCPGRSQR